MANENPTPGGLPEKPLGYRKITKITSDTTTNAHQEQETREDVSGRYKKRLVTSETREAKTSLIEVFEPSAVPAVSSALPAAWRLDLPSKVRIRITGVQPAGCADAEEFDGEYILELIEARPEQCRWELTLPPKCHLYRICLVAARAEGDAVRLRAFFEGSDRAPAWVAIVNGTNVDSVALAFDSFSAANPCAGCQWPDNVTAEPIFAERAYISPDPTDEELAIMAAASSSGCTSGGSQGYSILGPVNVPGLSEYAYGLVAPAGVDLTNIVWTVNKPTASIFGPNNEVKVFVEFKNTRPDWIKLTATFTVGDTRKSVHICIALVMVTVQEPKFAAPGTPSSAEGLSGVFLVNPPPPPQQPDWVVTHDPGSDCAAFTYNGTSQAPEAAVEIDSSAGAAPAFIALTLVTLTSPKQKPRALEQIEVGWIQSMAPAGTASYATTRKVVCVRLLFQP